MLDIYIMLFATLIVQLICVKIYCNARFGPKTCEHKWIVVKQGEITKNNSNKDKIGTWYDMQCSKCGQLTCKEFTLAK